MVTVQYLAPYIRKEDFDKTNPLRCVIKAAEIVERKEGPDLQLTLTAQEFLGWEARFSVWGKNKKTFIDALGNETDNWIGAKFDLYCEIIPNGKDGKSNIIKRVENVRKA